MIADESAVVRRMREKLSDSFEKERECITPQTLKETASKIHQWIADNAGMRDSVKKSSLALFNKNEDAAPISAKVQLIAKRLKEES